MTTLQSIPQPVLARVHGLATAAGCQLVATCDLAIAGASARFATPGVNIGLFCSTPMVALSRAVHAKQAMEMLLTGELISAQAALAYGLVNRVVPADQVKREARALAQKFASKSPVVMQLARDSFMRANDFEYRRAIENVVETIATSSRRTMRRKA